MIHEEDLARLYQNSCRLLAQHKRPAGMPAMTQFFRGKGMRRIFNKRLVTCNRHLAVFNTFNVIPEYCFSCYKIVIVPRNVVELFMLMVMLDEIDLPNDNTRKCMIELRENISGAYKGYIYFFGLDMAAINEAYDITRKAVSARIDEKVAVTIKRGCSEYARAYPAYAQVEKDGATAMQYQPEWKAQEDGYDAKIVFDEATLSADYTYNRSGYTWEDAAVMQAWLAYAATIGDSSYQKITGCVLQPDIPLQQLLAQRNRPPCNPADFET